MLLYNKVTMGKSKKSWITIKEVLGSGVKVKISRLCDNWEDRDRNSRYGGVIFWHKNKNRNLFPANDLWSVYIIIQDTYKWDSKNFKAAGQGMVHDYLFEQIMNESFDKSNVCASGFSISQEGEPWEVFNSARDQRELQTRFKVKYSSVWLNKSGNHEPAHCTNNDSHIAGKAEQAIIDDAIELWMDDGPGTVSSWDLTYSSVMYENNNIYGDDTYVLFNRHRDDWVVSNEYQGKGYTNRVVLEYL